MFLLDLINTPAAGSARMTSPIKKWWCETPKLSIYAEINKFQFVVQVLQCLWIALTSRSWRLQLMAVCTASIRTFTDWWWRWQRRWSSQALTWALLQSCSFSCCCLCALTVELQL